MRKTIIRWLWIALLGAIALHILLGIIYFIHALIPGSVCPSLEGGDYPCRFGNTSVMDVFKNSSILLGIIVVFSYGLSVLIPFCLIFIMGLILSYIKRKTSSNIVH